MEKAIEAIEFRLAELTDLYEIIKDKSELDHSKIDMEARIDELESLLDYLQRIKG